ncbi:hypothetical protein [Streptomyces cucumeris]|uniref:hypothetical protein n=1 Tax=Streptomyces cucumeris TaxID=2962890 RepID=UPI003D70F2EC
MKSEAALAFASGYLFGRRRRMRWAMALAGMAAGKRLASGRVPVNTDALPTSEIGKVGRDVRGTLVSAGRSAVVSAASNRMEALSDRMERRAGTLRNGRDTSGTSEESEEREPSGKRQAKGKESRGKESRGKESKGQAGKGKRSKGAARERKDTSGSRPGGRGRNGSGQRKSADRPAKARKRSESSGSGRRSQG